MRGRRRGLVPAGSCVQRGAYLRVRDDMCATVHARLLPQHPQWPPAPTPPYPSRPQQRREIFIWPLVLQEFQAF